jgi:hypothetical protein
MIKKNRRITEMTMKDGGLDAVIDSLLFTAF